MYICLECNYEFEKPVLLQEKHGLVTPPFEVICVCPKCKTENFEKIRSRFCRCCGAKLKENQYDYCSEPCKKRGEQLWQKELKRKKLLEDNPLYKIIRENEAYNKKYGKNLSYGQFTALKFIEKRGRSKNGKK